MPLVDLALERKVNDATPVRLFAADTYTQAFVFEIGIFGPFDQRASVPAVLAALAQLRVGKIRAEQRCRSLVYGWIVVNLIISQ